MAGLGGTVIARHDSTDEQRDAAQRRAHVAFGIGLERRFHRFALHAELRGVAMGARADAMEVGPQRTLDPRTAENLSAGQFNVGASFYF